MAVQRTFERRFKFTLVPGIMGLFLLVARLSHAQCAPQWSGGQTLPGTDGYVHSMVAWDPDGDGPQTPRLVLAGSFEVAGYTLAHNLASWDPATNSWTSIELAGSVEPTALLVRSDGELLAATRSTSIEDISARVVRRNGTSWDTIGEGFTSPDGGYISSMVESPDGSIFVTGWFDSVGGIEAKSVARWDGSAWSALGEGLDGVGVSLAFDSNQDLIAAGYFHASGTTPALHVARWDGLSWQPIGGGVPIMVYTMSTLPSDQILVAGQVDDGGYGPNQVYLWDGTTWTMIADADDTISRSLLLNDGTALIGGWIHSLAGQPIEGLARWDGNAWSPVGSTRLGAATALLQWTDGSIFTTGGFSITNGGLQSGISRWNASSWSFIRPPSEPDITIRSMAVRAQGDLVAVGGATYAQGRSMSRVRRWDGTEWTQIPGDFEQDVQTVLALPNGDLVVGGGFDMAGGVSAHHVARWDGSRWAPLGGGISPGGCCVVNALAQAPNGNIVAGGLLTSAEGRPANNVAIWNGEHWSPMGAGLDGWVQALAVLPSGQIVAGTINYPSTGGSSNWGVSVWNGQSWGQLGLLSDGERRVYALAVQHDGSLLAGGNFTSYGGTALQPVFRWNGSSWVPFGAPLLGGVNSIKVMSNGDVVLGGWFKTASDERWQSVARWDGADWTLMGVARSVFSVAELPNGDIAAGGSFSSIAGEVSPNFSVWGSPCRCPADLDNGTFTGVRDRAVTIEDLDYFLIEFELGLETSDLDNDGDPIVATPDGAVDINDLLFFLIHFEAGC